MQGVEIGVAVHAQDDCLAINDALAELPCGPVIGLGHAKIRH